MLVEENMSGCGSISNLHESVLRSIFSGLPNKEAVRTSILSRNWRWKWANMVADDRFIGNIKDEKSFRNFSETTLLVSSIRELNVSFWWYDLSRVEAWISTLLRGNAGIEKFHLVDEFRKGVITVPHNLLINNTSLRYLELWAFSYKIPDHVFFPNLTCLSLFNVEIRKKSSDTNVLEFTLPCVERFDLCSCKLVNVKIVNVYAPELTRFTLSLDGDIKDLTMKIVGAKLETFVYRRDLPKDLIMTCPNVVDAYLCNYPDMPSLGMTKRLIVGRLLTGFPNLKSCSYLKAITQSGFGTPKFDHLRRLVIHSPEHSEAVFKLLHATPGLKYLEINMLERHLVDYYWDAMVTVPSCISLHLEELKFLYELRAAEELVSHLEKVKFDYLAVPDALFDLQKFFVKYGVELKKVHFDSYYYSGTDRFHDRYNSMVYSRTTKDSEFSISKGFRS